MASRPVVQSSVNEVDPSDRAIAIVAKPHLDLLKGRQHGEHLTEEEDKAILAILAMKDGNIGRTAKLCGLSTSLVWNVKERHMGAFLEERERWKRSHILRLQDITSALTVKVTDAIETQPLSVRDGMVSLGIAIDKAAMLAGEGTNVNVNVRHSIDPAMIAADVARLRDIMGGRPVETLEAEFTVVDEDA